MPVWRDVEPSFRGSSAAIGDATTAFAHAVKGIGDIGRNIDAEKRYAEEKAQKDLLFAQAQEEHKRKLAERSAADQLAAGLLEGQQKTWYDINDDIRKNEAFNYGNIGVFTSKDAAGNTVYSDGTKPLTKDEADYRLKQQSEIGALLDKPQAYYEESRPEMYQRVLSGIKESGGVIPPSLVEELEKAKAAEMTAADAKRKESLASIAAKEKAILDLKTKYGEKLAEVGSLGSKVLDAGSETVSMSDQKVAGLKATQDAYKTSGINKPGAATNFDTVRQEVVGTLDKWFNTDDKETIDRVTKLTMEEGISPEVAANVLSMYKDSGLITNSFSEKPEVIEAAIRAAASGDKERFEASFKGPSRSESITKKNFITQEGYIQPVVTKYFEDQINTLNKQIAAEKAESSKLDLSPVQRQQAEKQQLAGDIEKILTGYSKPTQPQGRTTKENVLKTDSVNVPKPSVTTTKIYSGLTTKAKQEVDKIPSFTITAAQKDAVVKDIKAGLQALPKTADVKKFYDEFNGQLTQNAGDVKLDPLAILGMGAALKGLTPKAYTAVTEQIAKTKYGKKLLEKVDDVGQAIDKFDTPSYLRNIGPKLNVRPSSPIKPTTAKSPYSSSLNLEAPTIMRQGPTPPIVQGPRSFKAR